MRIIKKGKINRDKFIVFICGTCGCEFSAAPDEYISSEIIDGKMKVFSCCPDCHKVCATTKIVTQEQDGEQDADG